MDVQLWPEPISTCEGNPGMREEGGDKAILNCQVVVNSALDSGTKSQGWPHIPPRLSLDTEVLGT